MSDAGRYTEDIDNQADDNYSYDAIGNLVRDQQGGNEEIRWTVYGKIAGIHKTDGTQVYYSYDASGNRISKTVDRSGSTNPSAGVTTTWYVRDAQGNVLSTYEKRGSSPLEQTELHLYGSSRLGIQRTGGLVVEGSLVSLYTYSTETLVRGRKLYELSNHLGNVLATITDKKVLVSDGGSVGGTGGVCANGGLVEVLDVYNRDGSLSSYRARQEINFYSAFESGSNDEWEGYIDAGATSCDNNGGGGGTGSGMPAGAYYVADLVSATDYAPFGMGLVGRTYNSGAYKYGFNGQERSTEIDDNSYTAMFWEYDSRIGRRWNVDPNPTVGISGYVTFFNNPINTSDVLGDTPTTGNHIQGGKPCGTCGRQETDVQSIARRAIVNIAKAYNVKHHLTLDDKEEDNDVNASQLFYQWVMGTGDRERNFDENSTMGKQMLKAQEVDIGINKAIENFKNGKGNIVNFTRSLAGENELMYIKSFINDLDDNPARAFHGSYAGEVMVEKTKEATLGVYYYLKVIIKDKMSSSSGTRYPPSLGGYENGKEKSIFSGSDPYGPNGNFRTIYTNYNMHIKVFKYNNVINNAMKFFEYFMN